MKAYRAQKFRLCTLKVDQWCGQSLNTYMLGKSLCEGLRWEMRRYVKGYHERIKILERFRSHGIGSYSGIYSLVLHVQLK